MSVVTEIERLVEAGELKTASRRAQALAAAEPASHEAHNLLGFIAYSEDRLEDAERSFEIAFALSGGTDGDAAANLKAVRAALAAKPKDDFAGTVQDLARGHFGLQVDPLLAGRPAGRRGRRGPKPAPRGTAHGGLVGREALPAALRLTAVGRARRRVRERPAARRHHAGPGDRDARSTRAGRRAPSCTRTTGSPRASRSTWRRTCGRAWSAQGLLTPEQAETVSSGSFLEVYRALHSGHDYSPLVRPAVAYLPGAPGDNPFGDPALRARRARSSASSSSTAARAGTAPATSSSGSRTASPSAAT